MKINLLALTLIAATTFVVPVQSEARTIERIYYTDCVSQNSWSSTAYSVSQLRGQAALCASQGGIFNVEIVEIGPQLPNEG